MGLKPIAARWFEVLTVREQLARTLEALGQTGAYELEAHHEPRDEATLQRLRDQVEACERFLRRYRRFLPPRGTGTRLAQPEQTLRDALERMHAWAEIADPIIETLERSEREQRTLVLLIELLEALDRVPTGIETLTTAGGSLCLQCFASRLPPPPIPTRAVQAPTLVYRTDGSHHAFAIVVAPADEASPLQQSFESVQWDVLPVSSDLGSPLSSARQKAQDRLRQTERTMDALRADLQRSSMAHGLPVAVTDLQRIAWLLDNVPRLPSTRNFVRITGWTTDDGAHLDAALRHARIDAVLGHPDAPQGRIPPLVLRNPRWARPFETFVRLLGMPDRDEIDPSALVTVVVPLLFGFMFGDVGQGFVILLAGLALRRRFPQTAILVPAGAFAMVFGVLFGSVFADETVIEASWLHPLEHPVVVLFASVSLGAAILALGLVLRGIAAHWSGSMGRWLRTDAAFLLIYLGLLAMVFDLRAGWLAVTGVAWHAVGAAAVAEPGDRLRALVVAPAHLVERLLQLVVNTVSFARVGAFCLAHAGLSSAIVGMAAATGHGVAAGIVLVLGNALAIALEGLVVAIQTTRLVLFEFFVRFLRAQGRSFRPLPAPLVPLHPTTGEA